MRNMRIFLLYVVVLLTLSPSMATAGTQREEDLSDSVRTQMRGLISEQSPTRLFFDSSQEGLRWLREMSARLVRILPSQSVLQNEEMRLDFLRALHYESTRAGLSPQLMLAIVHVESAFRKYAISSAGARGYMQVMPFWVGNIGETEHNLFSLRTNLRYGTVIFRHYLDKEKGNLFRALGRYNGSLGKAKYPNAVFAKQEKYWRWP